MLKSHVHTLRVVPVASELRELASRHLLVVGGDAADGEAVRGIDAVALACNPVEAAERVVDLLAAGTGDRRPAGAAQGR